MLNNNSEVIKDMKNIIVTAHKTNYYVAASTLLYIIKNADISFVEADKIVQDLSLLIDSKYENIYIIGVRLKDDYKVEIINILRELILQKKNIKFFLIKDRFEIKGQEEKQFFEKFLNLSDEKNLIDCILNNIDFKKIEPDNHINTLKVTYYEFLKKENKITDIKINKIFNFINYTYNMYWKWDVGNYDILKDMIKKVAFDTITEEEEHISLSYDMSDYYLTGRSKFLDDLRKKIKQISKYNVPVFIYGETGSGKEVVAKLIHEASGRKGNFVAINCAGISAELMESMLFGHLKGAFTGAVSDKTGLIESANEGTLFLDEITEMPLIVQSKFLRFLEDFKFYPVGSNSTKEADVRIIAATNVNIREHIRQKRFRKDLYYRLSGVEIDLLPLKDRKEDIKDLANFILYELHRKRNFERITLAPKEYNMLMDYDWPGNIRQLQKFLMRVIIFNARGEKMKELLDEMAEKDEKERLLDIESSEPDVMTLQEAEKRAIIKALKFCNGNKTNAAKKLGITLNTLRTKIKEYNLESE